MTNPNHPDDADDRFPAAPKPPLRISLRELHVHTYECDQCHRPIRYTIQQFYLGNGKFMPASATLPPQCAICGSTPREFMASVTDNWTRSNLSFSMPPFMSFDSTLSCIPHSAEYLVERAEAIGPGGCRMLDMDSYTTCQTHFDTNSVAGDLDKTDKNADKGNVKK